jgi:hypothetical protein
VIAAPPPLVIVLPAGPTRVVEHVFEPDGVVLLNRLVVPHGIGVVAVGWLRHLAGVRVSSLDTSTCRRRGAVDICTQPEEWCPVPAAAWRFTITKRAGPAVRVTLHFVVGNPPP